jgi:glutathione synthase/RimK-type ligase-like ATP-grasp enzyme
MANIAMLYDRSETDELGIRLTAENMGVELDYFPFHKIAVSFNSGGFTYYSLGRDYSEKLRNVKVVINRTQSKSRRIFATDIFEAIGTSVLNPSNVELACKSKMRTLLALAINGIRIPKTVYIPANVEEQVVGGVTQNFSGIIYDLISKELGNDGVVMKPDAGTHGRGVTLAKGPNELLDVIQKVTSSLINPSGVVAQEPIPKWFYDLRIVVRKEKGKAPYCHQTALARGGFKDFRTNTYLGNKVFRASLPYVVRKQAEDAAKILGGDQDSWLIALDAMPSIGNEYIEEELTLRETFEDLEKFFNEVTRVKSMPQKKRNFLEYTNKITRAYNDYMVSKPYSHIQSVINETLEKCKNSVYFHEGNACPEFWEQTRLVGGINVAEDLITCALSLIDS